jgi:hypothetical protein
MLLCESPVEASNPLTILFTLSRHFPRPQASLGNMQPLQMVCHHFSWQLVLKQGKSHGL